MDMDGIVIRADDRMSRPYFSGQQYLALGDTQRHSSADDVMIMPDRLTLFYTKRAVVVGDQLKFCMTVYWH